MSAKRILIDIDTLLDTRLGLLHTLNPEAVKRVVVNDRYWLRDYDDWEVLTEGLVTKSQFDDAWKQRTTDILQHSMMTSIFLPLESMLSVHIQNSEEGISDGVLTVVVNEAPYQISDEVREGIQLAFQAHLSFPVSVIFINKTLKELDVGYVMDNFHQVFMYETHEWVSKHGFEIEKKMHCPGLTFVLPRLFIKDPSNLTTDEKKKITFSFAMVMRYYFEAQMIESEFFSMFRPSAVARLKQQIVEEKYRKETNDE
tara:strand:- start:177 stop:944 length:768 start_codon:yes stop_codon:yes gene_type:complete